MNSELSDDDMKKIEEEIPLGRIGQPEDIAKCVKAIADIDYITGQTISIDGGWTI